jgi:hypothetical protein
MIKYTIGIVFGVLIGFGLSFLLNKYRKNNEQEKAKSAKVKINIGSYLTRIGELRVYRAYMKEVVTSVDHVWGDIGKKYFSWMLSEKKLAMVFEFEVDFIYDLLSNEFVVQENSSDINIKMPKCKYDIKIKDFYFYDEQGTRLRILPEFLSSIFGGGVSEKEKNELVTMAIKQVEEISKKLAKEFQPDVHKMAKETINNILMGINKQVDSFSFYDKNIIDEQIVLKNPKLIEKKIS